MKYNQVISDRYSKEKKDMKIIKRNGSEEAFDVKKIEAAVRKADRSSETRSLTDDQIG